MAKRLVEECDLCKKEADLDNQLTIKPSKGKKTGRSYDICSVCKELLEKVFISRDGLAQLNGAAPVAKRGTPENRTEATADADTLELPDGSVRKIPSRTYKEPDVETTPGVFNDALPKGTDKNGKPCLHMNRTPARIESGSSKVTQICRDCNEPLPYKSARTKAESLNIKAE